MILQLKHLLILLMRLLAITCLVIAFAKPYIPSPLQHKKFTGRQAVSIYIDNSFSMEALSSGGRLMDAARVKAKDIADAFNPSDLFQLLTNDFEGRHQRFVNRDEFKFVLVQQVNEWAVLFAEVFKIECIPIGADAFRDQQKTLVFSHAGTKHVFRVFRIAYN